MTDYRHTVESPEELNQIIRDFIAGNAHEDAATDIIKIFLAHKSEVWSSIDEVTRVNIISEQLAGHFERVRLTYHGPEKVAALANEIHNNIIQPSILPSSFRNISELADVEVYLDLFIRDFFAEPVQGLAQHSPEIAQIFENSNRLLPDVTEAAPTSNIDDIKIDFEVPDMDLDI